MGARTRSQTLTDLIPTKFYRLSGAYMGGPHKPCPADTRATATDGPLLWWKSEAARTPYDPIHESPVLFREFADLDCTAGNVLQFIEQYGPLGIDHDRTEFCEGLPHWEGETQLMRLAIRLWEALRSGHATQAVQELRTWPVKDSDHRVVTSLVFDQYGEHDDLELLFGGPSLRIALVEPGATEREIVQAALSGLISRQFVRHDVQPGLFPNSSAYGAGLRLSFEAPNLIALLWLQLALAIDGNREYRTCPVCGNWWDATDARAHKKVCSDKCRAKKSYRERKEAAKKGDAR